MTEAEFVADLAKYHPVDNLQGLSANKVPMFLVHGDSDAAVPYKDNSGLLKERYEAEGGRIAVKVIAGEGHRVCSAFFECQELVDFVLGQLPAGE